MTMRRLGWSSLGASALAAVLLLAGTTATATASVSGQGARLASAAGSCSSAPKPKGHYLGLVTHDLPPSTTYLKKFAKATGVKPNLITYFQNFGKPFVASDACMATGQGALPFIQIEPFRPYTVSGIANGDWDSYLRAYAAAVKAFGARIALGFGHEMNGGWYQWGFGHVPPATFIAAWKHIHDVFAAAGVTNVKWVWTINRGVHPPKLWWPGKKYVTWVGISGYYRHSDDRWAHVFNSTLANVAKFSSKPILIAETAVGPFRNRARMITNFFAGLKRHRQLLGFTWFDLSKSENWRLEGDKPAVAAFKKAAPGYLRQTR
jgi:mannan endo-1,4-beta-mannosidase